MGDRDETHMAEPHWAVAWAEDIGEAFAGVAWENDHLALVRTADEDRVTLWVVMDHGGDWLAVAPEDIHAMSAALKAREKE